MKSLLLYVIICWIGIAGMEEGAGQAGSPSSPGTIDLLLFGKGWEAEAVEVSLLENPGVDKNWVSLTKGEPYETKNFRTSDATLTVIRDMDARRFVGQDIRENYVALRLKARQGTGAGQIYFRSAWVVEHAGELEEEKLKRWMENIRQKPLKMKEQSIATLIYPRSKRLEPGQFYIDHIELPVRHLKAGVQEVRWLDILFAP